MRAALHLVWALDGRHLVAHRTRLALSALGIAVGVALVVAVGTLNASMSSSLEAVARAAASEANVEIRPNGDTGLSPELLERVSGHESVEVAGATVESNVLMRSGDLQTRALVIGVDTGILRMSPEAIDPASLEGVDPLGLFLPPSIAEELSVRAGDRVEVTTPDGWREIAVSAVLDDPAQERSLVAVGAVGVVQELLGRGETYDAIYAKAAGGENAIPGLQAAVGPVATVGPIALRDEQVSQLLAGADVSFTVGTLVALFVGAFLVYNTMSMAAVERMREAAVMRAVGARRRQIFALFCVEGGLLGLVGSGLGVGLGIVLSRQLLLQRGGAIEEIFPVNITRIALDPGVLTLAGIAGVVASVAAAVLPARRVAHADPASALGSTGALEDPLRKPRASVGVLGVVLVAGGASLALSAVLGGRAGATTVTMAGTTAVLAGIALLIPVIVPWIARRYVGLISRIARSGPVRLGAEEMLRSPGRTAFTVGAVLLSLSLVVGFSIAQASFSRAFDTRFEVILSADLFVRSPTWRPLGSDVRLDDRLAAELEGKEGVAAAWPFRLTPVTHEDGSVLALAYDLDRYARFSDLGEADRQEAQAQSLAVGQGMKVLASTSVLPQLGYDVGDTFEMNTPTGRHELQVVGTLEDPSAITPSFIFEYETFARLWGTRGADTFAVVAADGVNVLELRDEILGTLGASHGVQVDTREEYIDRLSGLIDSVQQLISSVQLVAVLVAGLGLANTLLISTLERRRDLGVLRAVGMLRRQLRRMVTTEALAMGAAGVALAWGLGTLIGLSMYGVIRTQLGMSFPVVFPPLGYALAGLLGLAAAFLASLYPASRAARTDVVEALQYE